MRATTKSAMVKNGVVRYGPGAPKPIGSADRTVRRAEEKES